MTAHIHFVVDCGPRGGMGHLSRALTLARVLIKAKAVIRLHVSDASSLPVNLDIPAGQIGVPPVDADAVVIDGIEFSADDVMRFAAWSPVSVVVDDLGDRPVTCAMLVNHNIYGDRLDYRGYHATERLLGARYALVKPEFAAARTGQLRIDPRALVTFGGGATGVVALDVARNLAGRFKGPIDVAVGGLVAFPDAPLPPNVTVHRNGDVPALMARATLYVGSLGVTFVEALAAGLPVVAAMVADNQRLALVAAREMGIIAFERPDAQAIADAALQALYAAPSAMLEQPDGLGAGRVARALLHRIANP